ncbi:3-phosphoserine/phosphohydroxythreonine transaminase [Elizabethkingia anophelis]|uniref:3-phosphoserine/phosphohydroxythreonine transaminase n=1 Tax=Elizabethkingia anophelis TaxID=1117645 RepID=UPI000C6D690D|nr:3-phosphoserine/phosphohydroxythreonine transaminase [Elizabethkingia anophelis]PKR31084.1 3-phosphoserine/phosphohydroxythreonine transaminase [Elizabethkingia anophelis]PKR36731.1 3-phosphoserine/phosphohydroxythreonine transaminase [Elizabethkingia anophelis]PRQ79739.1 3-phosphoserine/phosphohydroxythreonine aminotransferase [Elizabethkingia anophelis]PRQ84026.1 3-phosphoserine/phosphohydroxythreonine aminotransferase [Elizabethkingia anophelis]PRQ85720.1 3-phosphoserine/phosphohydroxyth
MKKHNFSAGPCILPQEVFQKASEAILDFNGMGLSLLEISHRSKEFVAVMDEARAIVKRLMKLGDDYDVLFLQGGASLQFAMVPFNLMKTDGKAAYLDTGTWAAGAIKEAKKLGTVDIVGSSKDQNYSFIPKDYTVGTEYNYFHCTSNNTIYGTQMKEFPKTDSLMVCDMSSDIFSRVLDFSQFDLIYAGAQKNMGPAGATLVVVKKDILGKTGRDIPSYLNYQLHIDKESMYNTPPVFAVYTSLLTLQYLEQHGGIEAAEVRNEAKAKLLYDEIDRNPLFEGYSVKEDRSLMNVSFKLTDESKKEAFDTAWKAAGISGLNGHRSLGGYRASLYNALPIESVQVLVDVMKSIS